MTDETPAAPRRTRRRAAAAAKPDPLVGVMAEPEPGETAATEPTVLDAEVAASPGREEAPVAGAAGPGVTPGGEGSPGAPAAGERVLRLRRGGIAEATAGSVDVRLGGIGRLDAEDVFVQWGGVALGRADRLGVEFGSVGAALAGEARVTQGMAGSLVTRDATLEQSFVRTLIAQRVTANRPTGVLVMIAQHVSGDVRPVLDWRGAFVAGAVFAVISIAWRAIRGRD